ncbi:unnamed protein product [Schistocephalus solidus]|uniref:NDK domain-containing protein n=1 Tax=Schistocephalus solidus TaxID=70667 RepID=A0A183SIB4_SCHSO|nr:unnamed protein product [Schistocephalus solidus]
MIYRPPSNPSPADDSLLYLVKEVARHQEVLIAGDFNAPSIDWVHLDVDGAPNSFGNTLIDLNLDQPLAQKLQENDFEVAADEERVLPDEVLSVILADEQEDEDFEDRQNLFSSAPSRCLLIIKGSQGIFEEITPFFALHKTKETKDQEDHAQSSQELDTITEKGRQIERVRKLLFPCFTPAKVITSQQLDEKSEESPEMVKDEDGSVKSSPLEKSEDLKPQLILMVVLPPAAEAFRMEIMATLSEANFDIKVARECTLSEEAAREFCNIMKVDFNSQDLVNDMTSGTTIVVMASKNNAFEAIEEILGPESFSQAKENDPHSLRARYSEIPGTEKINDLPWIYASRSTKETLAWIPHFFPSEETLVGVQPDTTLQETLKTIKHTGFEIVSQKEHTMLEEDVRFLYQEFANHHHLMEDLVNNLNQSVITFLVLRAPAAVISWRTLMGCLDSEAGFAVPNTGEQPPSA